MGLRLWLLLASLAVNGALVFVLSRNRSTPVPLATAMATASAENPVAKVRPRLPAARGSTPEASIEAAPPESAAFHWSQLESADYPEYIARLRDFGVPERRIRDIIIADVGRMFRPRLAALRPRPSARTNFWERRYGPMNEPETRQQREQLRAAQKEQMELVKNLLGRGVYDEVSRESGWGDWTERTFGKVPEEHRTKLTELLQKHQEETSEIHAKAGYHIDSETQKELKAARRKFREALAGVLSPEQIEEYELRSSDTANQMRWQLRTFEPAEAEFRAIHKYKEATEELNSQPRSGSSSDEDSRARAQSRKELEDALAQTLGADRMKEYKLADQHEFQSLFEFGASKDAVFKVADMKTEAEAAIRKLRKDTTLSTEQRTEAMAAIRAETEKTLADLLGERRARGYTSGGGHWVRNLAPRQ